MQGDDNVLEEDNVLIPQWHGETRDDGGQNIEEFGGTIEFMVFMDKSEEALIHGLPDHFAPWHKFSVELMEDVLQVVSLNGLLGVEELEELLNKLGSNIDLKAPDLYSFVDDELQEKLVNSLEMGPSGIDLIFLLNTSLRELEIGLLDVRERSENVLLNHCHDIIKVGDDQGNHCFLIL